MSITVSTNIASNIASPHGGFKNRSEVNGAGLGEAASLKGAVKLGVFSLTRRLETKLLQGGGARAVVCMRGMLWG
jgi:hypothetical protein